MDVRRMPVGRPTDVRRTSDRRPTDVPTDVRRMSRRTFDGCPTDVRRTSIERPPDVRRTSDSLGQMSAGRPTDHRHLRTIVQGHGGGFAEDGAPGVVDTERRRSAPAAGALNRSQPPHDRAAIARESFRENSSNSHFANFSDAPDARGHRELPVVKI